MDLKNEWVKFVLNARIAFKHAPKSVAAAEQLLRFHRTGENDESSDALSICFKERSIAKHTAVMDAALDSYIAEQISKVSSTWDPTLLFLVLFLWLLCRCSLLLRRLSMLLLWFVLAQVFCVFV